MIMLIIGCLAIFQQAGAEQEVDAYLKTAWRLEEFVREPVFLDEIEASEAQRASIGRARQRLSTEMFEKKSADENANVHLLHREFVVAFENELSNILLPFQMVKARQLVLWFSINSEGFAMTMLEDQRVLSQLSLTDEDRNRITDVNENLQARFSQEFDELQQEYLAKLRAELDEDQQRAFDRKFGDRSVIGFPECNF